jgi:hypothetical protein
LSGNDSFGPSSLRYLGVRAQSTKIRLFGERVNAPRFSRLLLAIELKLRLSPNFDRGPENLLAGFQTFYPLGGCGAVQVNTPAHLKTRKKTVRIRVHWNYVKEKRFYPKIQVNREAL